MNWNMIEGNWRLYRNELQEHWNRLTNDGWASIDGKRPLLSRYLQENYGISHEEAEQQIAQFLDQVTTMPRYHSDRNHNERGHPRHL